MSWLPRFQTFANYVGEDDFEADCRTLQIVWLRWVFELTFGRIDDAR